MSQRRATSHLRSTRSAGSTSRAGSTRSAGSTSRPAHRLVLSCEHASRALPARLRSRFAADEALLASHRGWDPGALEVARALARRLDAPLVTGGITRLLVDLNRSPGHPAVVGVLGRRLSPTEQRALLEAYHAPHWARVREALVAAGREGRLVLHVGVHSFVPELDGRVRDFDVGLLYDPARAPERALAAEWQGRLRAAPGALRVRRNAPYRGTSDGLTTALRRELPAARYAGLELELNQARLAPGPARRALVASLAATLADLVHVPRRA